MWGGIQVTLSLAYSELKRIRTEGVSGEFTHIKIKSFQATQCAAPAQSLQAPNAMILMRQLEASPSPVNKILMNLLQKTIDVNEGA